ncbi:zinc/iron-chelating domain-containing protein [Halobacteriales archaeon QS_4_62_28]|nr:MAG: zinc/iron-chelating domain-containing protein [Halobacteriales archaeon QS_4_62_28]
MSLESDLERARALSVDDLADAIEAIGFECTRCGGCCTATEPAVDPDEAESAGRTDTASGGDPHTATLFPAEIRQLQATGEYDFRDVARPMPYGLDEGGQSGETFEWALQTDPCGNCTFYEESDGVGACTVHEDRPLICQTYPFSVALDSTVQPMGEAVDEDGMVRAHECEGLGREISREDARDLARRLKERAIRELEEAIGVRDNYRSVDRSEGEVVVHDSEGPKRPDGTEF